MPRSTWIRWAGINFFAAVPRVTLVSGLDSVYVSNVHAGTLSEPLRGEQARGSLRRLQHHAGYRRRPENGRSRPDDTIRLRWC